MDEKICEKLNAILKGKCYAAETLRKIPYSYEIERYKLENEIWEPESKEPISFETDLVVYEEISENFVKPRVIIESKISSVTTHDAITYSYKAEKHKSITPYIRYGIMLGDRGDYPLPGRLFRHGVNFDFMFSFSKTEPSDKEWDSFTKLVESEIEYSKKIEEMLQDTRKKDRKHYYMLQKQLVLKEFED